MKNKSFSQRQAEDELDIILDMIIEDAKPCIEAEERQRKIEIQKFIRCY
jgi:hypothetical protein